MACCAVGARWFGAQSALASDFAVSNCQSITLPGNRSAQVYNNSASAKCQVCGALFGHENLTVRYVSETVTKSRYIILVDQSLESVA